ncbi:flagellar basal body-associated FliL family protein [Chachezhania sediminis]|uniref:flagellar basal body-associated FliL family protein n=1 Tax=Chachezhania sediminis TaxID=2599291 RepID=UPI00131BFD75|nr:flagellar basal body-associated FliL family protein [Chachezhania sediminis]
MLGKLMPLIFLLVGAGIGVGAGLFLAPPPAEEQAMDGAEGHGTDAGAGDHGAASDDGHGGGQAARAAGDHGSGGDEDPEHPNEFVPFKSQFIVPVVKKDRVTSMIVLTLSLETGPGGTELIFKKEPKLRDAFLRVLFEHANRGGFGGTFTHPDQLDLLRTALKEEAQLMLGDTVKDVLIVDIARSDS